MLHCRDLKNLNSVKYFTNSKFPVSEVGKMFHKIGYFLQSSSLSFFKIWILRNILQSPDRHFRIFQIQSAKNMYVVQYFITVKLVHCTLNKLKLTFVLCATLPHFTCVQGGGGGLERLCVLVDQSFSLFLLF